MVQRRLKHSSGGSLTKGFPQELRGVTSVAPAQFVFLDIIFATGKLAASRHAAPSPHPLTQSRPQMTTPGKNGELQTGALIRMIG